MTNFFRNYGCNMGTEVLPTLDNNQAERSLESFVICVHFALMMVSLVSRHLPLASLWTYNPSDICLDLNS